MNQVFLGDSILPTSNIESQIQFLKNYEEKLKNLQNNNNNNDTPIWNQIDNEITSLNDNQKQKLFGKSDYINLDNQLQNKVQNELLNLVKSKIENSEDGKTLLKQLLDVIKTQKKIIVEESNKELDLFNKFKEFSKENPNMTYEQFIKMIV